MRRKDREITDFDEMLEIVKKCDINKNINKLKKSQNRLIRFYKMSKNFAKY